MIDLADIQLVEAAQELGAAFVIGCAVLGACVVVAAWVGRAE